MVQRGEPRPSINHDLLHASTAETRTRMSKWHATLSRVWCCRNTIQERRNLLEVLPWNELRHVGQDNSIGADHRGELSPPIKHTTMRRVRTYTMHHRSFIQRHLLGRTIQRHLVGRGVSRHFLDREFHRALHATANQTPGQTNTLSLSAFRLYHRIRPGDHGILWTATVHTAATINKEADRRFN